MELKTLLEDERGSINVVVGSEFKVLEEITIFKTKAGWARGGCVHEKSEEHLIVLEGEITYTYMDRGVQEVVQLIAGDRWTIPSNTPHFFVSVTDSVVMEWGPSVEEKQNKHQVFRQKVEEHNAAHPVI